MVLAGAPSFTFVDPEGLCAGLSPCFSTIQGAVDVAGEAPAVVSIFPGLYAESVDLEAMNGGNPNAISLISVDAEGTPTPHTATIDPGTDGGPGSGSALFYNSTAAFPGDIAIEGLIVRSPDSEGIFLEIVGGNVTIRDVIANQCSDDGVELDVVGLGHFVEVDGLEASHNGSSGLEINQEEDLGRVRVFDSALSFNGEDGLRVRIGTTSTIDAPATPVHFERVEAVQNGGDGTDVDTWGLFTVLDSVFSGNVQNGINVDAKLGINIRRTSADDNLGSNADGFDLDTDGSVVLDSVVALRNVQNGIRISDFTNGHGPAGTRITNARVEDSGAFAVYGFGLQPGRHAVECSSLSGAAAIDLRSDVTFLARGNWWGSETGPTHPNLPSGQGAEIFDSHNPGLGPAIGTVDYSGHLTSPLSTESSCLLFDDGFESGDLTGWSSSTP